MNYQEKFLKYCEHYKLPVPEFEWRFCSRKWRIDIAFVSQKIAIEVQGGIWINGRHNRGKALKNEWKKLNTMAVLGWRCLFVEPADLFDENFFKTLLIVLSKK